MANDNGGGRSTQKALITAAGSKVASDAAGIKLSGADLEQAKLLNIASTNAGPTLDGARLAQLSERY